jgi:hypothetical protein
MHWIELACRPEIPGRFERFLLNPISQSEVGLMTTISGLVGLAAQTPAGAAINATKAKRGGVVISSHGQASGRFFESVVGDVFGPPIAAFTLGLYLDVEWRTAEESTQAETSGHGLPL